MAGDVEGTAPRAAAPEEQTHWDEHQPFRVWVRRPTSADDGKPWKCAGAFLYFLEALDFIRYCSRRGVDAVFQSPAGVRRV